MDWVFIIDGYVICVTFLILYSFGVPLKIGNKYMHTWHNLYGMDTCNNAHVGDCVYICIFFWKQSYYWLALVHCIILLHCHITNRHLVVKFCHHSHCSSGLRSENCEDHRAEWNINDIGKKKNRNRKSRLD